MKPRRHSLSVKNLLGRRLNDVEERYAPKILHICGQIRTPLPIPRVSVIGTRAPSAQGLLDTKLIAEFLVRHQAIVVSGLARGIDTEAHRTAIDSGGQTIAVLGTPLDRIYPAENTPLQQKIMKEHLAVSQYADGSAIAQRNFVMRNRTMALISDASVIVEAGEGSGSLHQGWETLRLGHPLFLCKTVFKNSRLNWPQKMLDYGAIMLSDPQELLDFLPSSLNVINLFE